MRDSREIEPAVEGKHAMTKHDTHEQEGSRAAGGAPRSKSVWGHSLPAAAVCVAAGATIALAAIFGQPG